MTFKKMNPQVNDGFEGILYEFGRSKEVDDRLNYILNEATHVQHYHSDGNWESEVKDCYANMLKEEIRKSPSLIQQLKQLEDRVVLMVMYRAIELLEEEKKEMG